MPSYGKNSHSKLETAHLTYSIHMVLQSKSSQQSDATANQPIATVLYQEGPHMVMLTAGVCREELDQLSEYSVPVNDEGQNQS